MRRSLLAACIALSCLLTATANAKDWSVDVTKSTLGFSGTYQGEKFSGKFGKFDAVVTYDAANLAASKFDVSIDVTSARTGNNDYDEQLKGADFFDFSKFPKARFVTTAFRQDGAKVLADGTLTIRDKSKPVTLDIKFTESAGGATLDVSTTLKRLDFDVGGGDWKDTSVIANEVPVTAHLVLTPKG